MLSPFYIKLQLIRQYIKTLDKSRQCCDFISQKCNELNIEKLKAGILDRAQEVY